ncbi:MAG TPA: hypothetical protein VFK57_20780 [Vicinamibacterales bacterium]|nr:hypothetical protein [Vicinamibacterales bacterium]
MSAGRVAAWSALAIAALDLAGRQIARRSLLQVLPGPAPSPEWVAAAALIAAIAGLAVAGRRPAAAAQSAGGRAGVVIAALFVVGLALQLQLGARLQSDGFYYFAYLRSLAFDRDVNFMNDYRMLGLGDKPHLFQPTRTGHAESAWTIGPAIVWSPFFAAGHVAATRLRARGLDVAADGTSYPYRQAVCVAGLFYGLLGCWFSYRLVRMFFAARIAGAAVFLTVAGSFMAWYLVKEPSMTHAPSMAAVAGFIWAWGATRTDRSLRGWAALGLLAGFMALIRWQNLLFALLPGIDALLALVRAWRSNDRPALRHTAAGSALFLGCGLVAFLPQMLAWKAIYGTFIARSPVGPQVRWTDPHLVDILWSARNGLFSTTPILYLGALGLIAFAIARPAIGVPALLTVGVMVYFNACIQDWWGSAGYGGRRFDGTIPLFALGLAAFVHHLSGLLQRHATGAAIALLAAIAVWNAALMQAAQDGAVRIGETLSFDRAWAAQARVVHRWFGNPFTYPASLIFAARNGVTPGDYDLMWTNRFLADPLQPYGRVDVGADDEWLLGGGWHTPEREGEATFRWAASPAALRIPLDRAAPLRLQIRAHAFAYPGAPPQTLSVQVNGSPGGSCDALAVPPGWQIVECALPEAVLRSGVNLVELRFGYTQRPMDVGAGGDARPLAAAVDWVRVSVADTGR